MVICLCIKGKGITEVEEISIVPQFPLFCFFLLFIFPYIHYNPRGGTCSCIDHAILRVVRCSSEVNFHFFGYEFSNSIPRFY